MTTDPIDPAIVEAAAKAAWRSDLRHAGLSSEAVNERSKRWDENPHSPTMREWRRRTLDALEAASPLIAAKAGAKALREAADQLDAYNPRDNPVPDDPRWTCDLGYYGESHWLRERADALEAGQS